MVKNGRLSNEARDRILGGKPCLPFEVRIISQNAHHMGIGRLATATRFLDLFLLDLWPYLDDLVLACWCDTSFLQLLLDGLLIRNFDLRPDLAELLIEMLH